MAYSVQASSAAFDYITGKIKSKEWAPGTKISTEAQLCAQLGISRIAVRQAIEKLSALSVLRKVQGSGTYVEKFENVSLPGMQYYPPTRDNMRMVLEFRMMFDSYNVALFLEKCDERDVQRLERNYRQMCDAEGNHPRFRKLDDEFHSLIAQGTKNAIIFQTDKMLSDILVGYKEANYRNFGVQNALEYHGMMMRCIKARDAKLAERYSREHIERLLKSLQEITEQEFLEAVGQP